MGVSVGIGVGVADRIDESVAATIVPILLVVLVGIDVGLLLEHAGNIIIMNTPKTRMEIIFITSFFFMNYVSNAAQRFGSAGSGG